ncbi:MAG: C4-dicarboxylate ABC transporter [Hydrogenophaga sp.]|nr:C4-dicarboxylate ABC transporter [Hydrogenophaga sp.]
MSQPAPLKFLMPGWFALVMGLCGVALAWHRAQFVLGDMASGVALMVGAVAAVVFVVLVGASLLRASRHADALAEDLRHPVRHAFVAAIPVSLLLLATVGVALDGTGGSLALLWRVLWWVGSLTQVWATWWVLSRWIAPAANASPAQTGLWPGVTPVLLIPVVGNVVAPLAGIPLGVEGWSDAQMGVGAFFWPVVVTLVLVRRLSHSPLPERLVPAWFITVAPPAVIGLVLLQMDAPLPLVQALWGLALFFLAWVLPLIPRIMAQPFGVSFWALSFPLAAFTTLTLALAERQPESAWHSGLQGGGLVLLAVTSMAVLWLCQATVRGLRNGSLLVPEPVAQIAPAPPA